MAGECKDLVSGFKTQVLLKTRGVPAAAVNEKKEELLGLQLQRAAKSLDSQALGAQIARLTADNAVLTDQIAELQLVIDDEDSSEDEVDAATAEKTAKNTVKTANTALLTDKTADRTAVDSLAATLATEIATVEGELAAREAAAAVGTYELIPNVEDVEPPAPRPAEFQGFLPIDASTGGYECMVPTGTFEASEFSFVVGMNAGIPQHYRLEQGASERMEFRILFPDGHGYDCGGYPVIKRTVKAREVMRSTVTVKIDGPIYSVS